MQAIHEAAAEGRRLTIGSTCERPEPFVAHPGSGLFDD